jgi:DNA ligase D-like protein (predicted 3'-phosphoesterase)
MAPRFVIQKHQARTLHYDLRLERDGVFKSWAVPKGLPDRSGIRRLAIQVEDHSLEFGDFHGTIPEGEYGAGSIEIWDRGTYQATEWNANTVVFSLSGQRLQGTYTLIRFSRKGDREWLIFRQADLCLRNSAAD